MSDASRRRLLPREHGAYAQLLLPLAAALTLARPSAASLCLAAAACVAFVAHEPTLVLLGHSGTRARREHALQARRWLAACLGAGIALSTVAFWLSPPARAWLLVPAVFAAATIAVVMRRRERTLGGEVLACVALGSAAVPVAIASAVPWADAVAAWGVFCAAFSVSTVEVRSVARADVRAGARIATWTAASSIVVLLALSRPLLALASIPVVGVVAFAMLFSPSPAALRRLGWTLATSSVVTAAAVVIALRVQ